MFNKHYKIDLKQKRKDLGLTQVDLAKKCSMAKSTVQALENRKSNATVGNLKKYAKVLNINPMDIMDSEHKFKHYEDMSEYDITGIDSIKDIRNICLKLASDRINQVHSFSKKMIDEQENLTVNFANLNKQIKHYSLEVKLLVHNDSSVETIREEDRKYEDFDGKIPRDYTICTKFKTGKILGYTYNQIVFLKKATLDGMYSGVNVVVLNKDNKLYVRKYRSFKNTQYLIPLTSHSAQKSEEELGKEEDQYIWNGQNEWIEAKYLINQPSY